MERIELIKGYYGENFKRANAEHEILGWESKEAQYERFAALSTSVDLNGLRILDVGCGLGNLYEYLKEKNIQVTYTGVDVLPEMIDNASKKGLDCEFICTDLFKNNPFEDGQFDVVYASGIFNLNLGNNKQFLEKALKLFFGLSSKYVCFNLLYVKSPNKEDKYFYFTPSEALDIIDLATNEIEVEARVIQDYLNNDFTVVCEKITIK